MDIGLFNQTKRFINREKMKINQKILIFLFFVLISTIFWFFNALSKSYSTSIKVPVKFTNFPEDKILVNTLPADLDLDINAHGFTIARHNLNPALKPVVLNVRSMFSKRREQKNVVKYYVPTESLKDQLEKKLRGKMNVLHVRPDTLYFEFAELIRKKVPVRVDIDVSCAEQYMLNGNIKVIPDSLEISGPSSMLDTINYVQTKYFEFTGLKESISRSFAIQRNENLTYSTTRIKIEIPVDKYTEAAMNLPIQIKNVPDSVNIQLLQDSVTVFYLVSLSEYPNIEINNFSAEINYNDFKEKKGLKARVKLKKFPGTVRSIRYKPKYVEYFIEISK